MAINNLESLNENILSNLKNMVHVETIVGEPILCGGITIIPISKANFGFGAGGSDIGKDENAKKFGGGSGGAVTIQPIAFLVIQDGHVQLLQLADKNNTADRIINMVPEVMEKINGFVADSKPKKDQPPVAMDDQGAL